MTKGCLTTKKCIRVASKVNKDGIKRLVLLERWVIREFSLICVCTHRIVCWHPIWWYLTLGSHFWWWEYRCLSVCSTGPFTLSIYYVSSSGTNPGRNPEGSLFGKGSQAILPNGDAADAARCEDPLLLTGRNAYNCYVRENTFFKLKAVNLIISNMTIMHEDKMWNRQH